MKTIKKKRKKKFDVVDIKEFLKGNIEVRNVNYFPFIVLFLFVIFLVIGHFKILNFKKEIAYLNNDIVQLENIINRKNDFIKTADSRINFYKFKDFYNTVSDKEISKILDLIWKYSNLNELNPYHMLMVASVESSFDPKARSHMGAYGIMQIHYISWKNEYKLKSPEDLYDIELNIKLGCEIFKYFIEITKGDVPKALLMYNSGNNKWKNDEYIELIQKSKFFKGIYNVSDKGI